MFDIRDHGGSFSKNQNLPMNYAVIKMGYYAGIKQMLSNGDIFGYTQGRYSSYQNYYHIDKIGNLIKSLAQTSTLNITGYFKDFYVVCKDKTISVYSHDGSLLTSYPHTVADEYIREGIKYRDFWILKTYNQKSYSHFIRVYKTDGTLISSITTSSEMTLYLNLFGVPIFEQISSTTSAGNQALIAGCLAITKNGAIVEFGSATHTYEGPYSLGAALVTIFKNKFALIYNN